MIVRCIAVAVTALAALPAAASAATEVSRKQAAFGTPAKSGAWIIVRNAELITPAQDLRMTDADGLITVRDADGGRVNPGDGCRHVGAQTDRVVCQQAATTGISVGAGPGDDFILNGTPLPAVIDGDNGDDRLTGSTTADQLNGGNGEDELDGQGGDDRLDGGRGKDRLHGFTGDDLLIGGADNDLLDGADGDDRLDGGDGFDTLRGEDGDDVMIGGAGPDDFDGVGGIDTADYSGHPQPAITVDIGAGGFNDGNSADELQGIRDNVRANVERVIGTVGPDLL